MILGAASGGEVTVDNVIPQHLESVTAKLREAGVQVETNDDQITVNGDRRLKVVDIKRLYIQVSQQIYNSHLQHF